MGLFVIIQVQKSPVFRRDGADIHSDLFVSVAQAILGGSARTQGLYETLNLSVSLAAVTSLTQIKEKYYNLVQFKNRLTLSPLFRFLQESRLTRGSACQEKELLVLVAMALVITMSM